MPAATGFKGVAGIFQILVGAILLQLIQRLDVAPFFPYAESTFQKLIPSSGEAEFAYVVIEAFILQRIVRAILGSPSTTADTEHLVFVMISLVPQIIAGYGLAAPRSLNSELLRQVRPDWITCLRVRVKDK